MAEEAKEIQFIDWRRCFAFLEILRSFRIAIHPVKIFLCFVGLAASLGVGVVVDQIPYVGQTNVTVPTSPVRARVITVGGREFPLPGLNIESERTSYLDNVREIGTRTVWGQWALPYVNGKSWGDFADFALSPVTAGRQSIELIIAYWREAWLFALDQHDPGAGDLGGRRDGRLPDGGGADRPRGIRADGPGPGVRAQEVAERRHQPPPAVRCPRADGRHRGGGGRPADEHSIRRRGRRGSLVGRGAGRGVHPGDDLHRRGVQRGPAVAGAGGRGDRFLRRHQPQRLLYLQPAVAIRLLRHLQRRVREPDVRPGETGGVPDAVHLARRRGAVHVCMGLRRHDGETGAASGPCRRSTHRGRILVCPTLCSSAPSR